MPAIAIYMTDDTKMMHSMIKDKKNEEEALEATQVETFTATVSHEMRTPMSNCLIFLDVIVKTYDLLCASCVLSEHLVLIRR